MITSNQKPKSDHSFFYWEKGRRQDAKIHEPMLAGDHAKAKAIGRKVAKQLGLTDAELKSLYDEPDVE
jgi:hypothetical protein